MIETADTALTELQDDTEFLARIGIVITTRGADKEALVHELAVYFVRRGVVPTVAYTLGHAFFIGFGAGYVACADRIRRR